MIDRYTKVVLTVYPSGLTDLSKGASHVWSDNNQRGEPERPRTECSQKDSR